MRAKQGRTGNFRFPFPCTVLCLACLLDVPLPSYSEERGAPGEPKNRFRERADECFVVRLRFALALVHLYDDLRLELTFRQKDSQSRIRLGCTLKVVRWYGATVVSVTLLRARDIR